MLNQIITSLLETDLYKFSMGQAICTGICVISNAIIAKTFCPEAEINIISEACACVTPESHKTALEAMKLLQMNII